jgi:hypothetical protein
LRPGDALPPRYEGGLSRDELHRQASIALTRLHALELLRLLGYWASELEPEMICDRYGNLRGLGYAGRLIVPAYC